MTNTRIFQKRFDEAIETLQLTFTDLLLFTEQLDARVTELEREVAAVKRQGELQQMQIDQLLARLDGRQ